MSLFDWDWPEGFELGRTARVRQRCWEGTIVDLMEPEDAIDVAVVIIKRFRDSALVYASMDVVEIKGIDYEAREALEGETKRRRKK